MLAQLWSVIDNCLLCTQFIVGDENVFLQRQSIGDRVAKEIKDQLYKCNQNDTDAQKDIDTLHREVSWPRCILIW